VEAIDPLGKLRDKVIATLNRRLAAYSENEVNPMFIEEIIRSVGRVHELGLKVEDAEVIEFTPNIRLVKDEKLYLLKEHTELARDVFEALANRDQLLLKARLEEIKPAIKDYIDRQKEIEDYVDPEMILHWLDLAATSSGAWIPNLVENGQFVLDSNILTQVHSQELLSKSTEIEEDHEKGSENSLNGSTSHI
jgi:hypothetical protein